MRTTKIVRIISRLNVGGPAIHTVLLSEALNRKGYVDILVCGTVSESEGDMAYFASAKGVRPIVVPELKRDISFKNDLKAFLKLYAIIRKERPDIVHTHAAKAGALGRLAALCAGVPVKIHTFHGHIFDGYFSPLKAKVFLAIERFLALFTTRVVTVSDAVRSEIVDTLKVTGGDKCVVVRLGLELGAFLECGKARGAFRAELGVKDDTLLIGIVGRLVPIKNHALFFDAAKMVLERDPGKDIRLVVIGDGELRAFLEQYAKKAGIDRSVYFVGWRSELGPVYADLDIVALTSLNEGTPVSLIEAMAAGRPVVATQVGGVEDLISDGVNGYLVPSRDAAALAGKLARLIGDPGRRNEFGSRGRERVRQAYSKERLVGDIEALYDECLAKN